MSILADHQIKSLCVDESGKPLANAMILPFGEATHRPGVISWGCSSYGYDVRVGDRFKVLRRSADEYGLINPKEIDEQIFYDVTCEVCIIPPNSFALAETVEHFEIPRNVLAVCLGKSTYARCGIIINVTPLEPEWRGKITLEISNTTPLPAMIYAGEGICQLLFFRSEEKCERSYEDKRGKYQDQPGITLPKVL